MKRWFNFLLLLLLVLPAYAQDEIMSGGTDDGGGWIWKLYGTYTSPASLPFIEHIAWEAHLCQVKESIPYGTFYIVLSDDYSGAGVGVKSDDGGQYLSWEVQAGYGFDHTSYATNPTGHAYLYKKTYVSPLEAKLSSNSYTVKSGEELQVSVAVSGGSGKYVGSWTHPSWLEANSKTTISGTCRTEGQYSVAVTVKDSYTGESVSDTATVTVTKADSIVNNDSSTGGSTGNTGSGTGTTGVGDGSSTGTGDGSSGTGTGTGPTTVGDGSSTGTGTGDSTTTTDAATALAAQLAAQQAANQALADQLAAQQAAQAAANQALLDQLAALAAAQQTGSTTTVGDGITSDVGNGTSTTGGDGTTGSTTGTNTNGTVTTVGDGTTTGDGTTGNGTGTTTVGTGVTATTDAATTTSTTDGITTTTVTDTTTITETTTTKSDDYTIPLLLGAGSIAVGMDVSVGGEQGGKPVSPQQSTQQSPIVWDMRSNQ